MLIRLWWSLDERSPSILFSPFWRFIFITTAAHVYFWFFQDSMKAFSFSVENQQINSQWKSFQALIYTLSCSYKDRDSLPWILLSLERHSRCMCAKPLGVLRATIYKTEKRKQPQVRKQLTLDGGERKSTTPTSDILDFHGVHQNERCLCLGKFLENLLQPILKGDLIVYFVSF